MSTTQTNSNNRAGSSARGSKINPSALSAPGSAFTLIELLVVIGIIALLAGLAVGGSKYASTKMKESRIRAELHALVTAIEAYHAEFNQYPPDNVVRRDPILVNPVTNALYYELTGVIVDDAKGTYHSPERQQRIPVAAVKLYFGLDGFQNSGTSPREIKSFLRNLKADQRKPIAKLPADIQVLTVPVDSPLNNPRFPPPINSPDPDFRRINPWRYVSTQPTNNPATFDLWAEYVDGGEVKIIGNWNK